MKDSEVDLEYWEYIRDMWKSLADEHGEDAAWQAVCGVMMRRMQAREELYDD